MEKIKILAVGDAVATTGFARVLHSVLTNLPKDTYEIHHLGVNYFGDPHTFDYKIYPAFLGKDVYGLGRISDLIEDIQPDLMFFLNDAWILDTYFKFLKEKIQRELLPPIVTYFPVDALEHSKHWYTHFDIVNEICVYTEFGRNIVQATGEEALLGKKITIIPHGIDLQKFYPGDKEEARRKLYPKDRIDEFLNSFIVFNGNRNQPRKRIDLTMWAFRDFQKDKPDVKLYLHMGITDDGINILELAHRYEFSTKFVISGTELSLPNVPDSRLNTIYNGTDIGINTSLGEGWGLVSWEHAATGAPQIVPHHSALPEIWGDSALYIPTAMPRMIEKINTVGYVVDYKALVGTLNWAYKDWKSGGTELNKLAKKGFDLVNREEYKWSNVALKFHEVFLRALNK